MKKRSQPRTPPLPRTSLRALGLALLVLALAGCSQERKNIILISIDTLRGDHLGYTGYAPEGLSPSPCIDALADEGTVFTHMKSSASWTLPGHYTMLTGLPSELHDMVDDRVRPNPGIQTLAQFLKEKGYATGGFYSGPYLHEFFGFDRGFDWYEPCMGEETLYDVIHDKGSSYTDEERKEISIQKERRSHLAVTSTAVKDKALAFAKMKGSAPLFMFLHFFDVHNDYIPPAPFNRRYRKDYRGWVNGRGVVIDPRINPSMKPKDLERLIGLYDGEIAWVDHNIQLFLQGLEKNSPGILDRSIVVVVSDHGEEFFEHGKIGHRANLYETSLDVPFLIRAKGLVPSGQRVDRAVRLYDLFPTVLDLAGFEIPDTVYGRSLVPLIQGKPFQPEPVSAELTFIPGGQQEEYQKHFAFQSGPYKLIGFQRREWSITDPVNWQGALKEEQYELYDLEHDPGERTNLFEQEPELAKQLFQFQEKERERMRACYKKLHGGTQESGQEARNVPKDLIEEIEKTGYGAGARDQNR